MATLRTLGVVALVGVGALTFVGCGSPAKSASKTLPFLAPGFHANTGSTGDSGSTGNTAPAPPATTTTTTTVPPTTTTLPVPGPTTIAVTGTGPASDVTIDVGGQESQHTQVPLPWSTQVPQDSTGLIVMNAQDGSGASAATITCTISDNFGTLNTNTSTGPYSVVSCQDQP